VKHGETILSTTNEVNLVEAILLAGEQVGKDGKGTGGLVGYLSVIARRRPALYVRLLEKLLACDAAALQNEAPYTPEEAKIPRSHSKSGWN
jgi:hypothetical protein